MIDLRSIREGPSRIKKDLEKRNQKDKVKWIDEIIVLDNDFRNFKKQAEELRHKRNNLSLEINEAKRLKRDINKIIREAKLIPNKIKQIEEKQNSISKRLEYLLMRIPNYLDPSVPIGKDASENKIIKKIGVIPKFHFELKPHVELIEDLKLADFEAGRKVAGQGFNYLTGDMALLDHALQRYGIDFILKEGFKLVVPPMLLNKETLSGAVDLSAFEEVIYKIENEDLYLIGTAEHSLVSMLKDKTLKQEDLPIKICALTPCFRKEIGGHGVDTKGLFRMHQFNKVEQVVICNPKDSSKMLEQMQNITEKFFKSLKIPFRVIEICSADLGGKFSKQYDIEAWFPRQNEYKEVTSAGNCTDYQARRLNIKYENKGEKEYVHILNNTMVATSRAMVSILENYQQKDGSIKIPLALQKYMNNQKKIWLNKSKK